MEWTQKIVEYQAAPPSKAWQEIEKVLDEHGNSLYTHVTTPPEDSWEAISARLSSQNNVPSAKVYTWFRPFMRYAAIVLMLAFVTTSLINNNFRNALLESIKTPGMKAALTDTTGASKKDTNNIRLQDRQIPQQTHEK